MKVFKEYYNSILSLRKCKKSASNIYAFFDDI